MTNLHTDLEAKPTNLQDSLTQSSWNCEFVGFEF